MRSVSFWRDARLAALLLQLQPFLGAPRACKRRKGNILARSERLPSANRTESDSMRGPIGVCVTRGTWA